MRKEHACIEAAPFGQPAQIWTVISVIDEKIDCSIHASEYQAHCELVSRFESLEVSPAREAPELKLLLRTARECGNYELVRAYIRTNARRMDRLQLAEHYLSSATARS